MIVYNLRCAGAHLFEGWFGSPDDYLEQREREFIACPMCGSTSVERQLSAPRLNLSSGPTAAAPPPAKTSAQEGMRRLRALLARSEDVGERFPEEARRIHYDEAPARPIRGQASGREFAELVEEGIAVLPLPEAVTPDSELN
ncbi:hypothetical protein BURK2_02746 [Burkholderiales bacterium]|nr:MAG: DUF1178 family protein [Burkholderiales bacterium]CAG0997077.1 hypothetical protein BURK2_02746 [Burkholderiales bacterium]